MMMMNGQEYGNEGREGGRHDREGENIQQSNVQLSTGDEMDHRVQKRTQEKDYIHNKTHSSRIIGIDN